MFGIDIGIVWQWLIVGLILVFLEVVMPGVFLLWFGLSALITAIVALIFPELISLQLIIFSCLSIVMILVVHKYIKKKPSVSEHPNLNRRGEQYIGKKSEFNGGKIKIADSWWLAVSDDDLKDGDKVEVVGMEGTALKVKKV